MTDNERAKALASKKFLSPREFGEIVGVGHRIIQRDCQHGRIKAEQVGTVFAIPVSEVERYLQRPEIKPGRKPGEWRGGKKVV
jgi:hypothetical protein